MNERYAFDYPTPEPTPSPPSIKEEESSPPSAVPTSTSLHLESPPPLVLSPASLPPGVPRLDKKRTLPCERCRTIRRACKRAELSPLEWIPSTRTQTRRTASIGPSSPEARWSTLHMSYSLTHHLVEMGLTSLAGGFFYPGFDYRAFVSRLNASRGRLEGLGPADHLFSLVHMYVGIHVTNHSAVLRTGASSDSARSPTLREPRHEGLDRREPFLAVARAIYQQVDTLEFDPRSNEAAGEHVAVWHFALGLGIGFADFEAERLLVAREILRRGFRHLADLEQCKQDRQDFLESFRELAMVEFRLSLELSDPTIISPSAFHDLFGHSISPGVPDIPIDISFMFSAPPEPTETRRLAITFQDFWRDLPSGVYLHLGHVLAYTPTSNMHVAINYCWARVEALLLRLREGIDRLLSDPRYREDVYVARQRGCVGNFIYDEGESMFILRYCHNVVTQTASLRPLVGKSRQLWFDSISHWATRLNWIPQARRVASIGPSSPEAKWSTLHMSYSLKHHLIENRSNTVLS
ncbi:hypothetical protein JCM3766R1_004940 [Sporobolomyces carnicolor]